MHPHTIRLRGPWEFRTLSEDDRRSGVMTLPGFWHAKGLPDYWGAVELRRGFNWMASLDPHEQVFLQFDQVFGSGTATLNGEDVLDLQPSWGVQYVEITSLLRSRNELSVTLCAAKPDPGDAVFGTLGLSADDATPEHRRPVGGIVGDVRLSVQDRGFAVIAQMISTDFSNSSGALDLTLVGETNAEWLPKGPLQVGVCLDGVPVADEAVDSSESVMELHVDGLPVTGWSPRSLGTQQLYELEVEIRCSGRNLWTTTRTMGFRRLERAGETRWSCNGQTVTGDVVDLWPDRTFEHCLGEKSQLPFDQWSLAQSSYWRIAGHIAPDEVYRLADRAGVLVIQDAPDWQALSEDQRRQLRRRLADVWSHPSVAATFPVDSPVRWLKTDNESDDLPSESRSSR